VTPAGATNCEVFEIPVASTDQRHARQYLIHIYNIDGSGWSFAVDSVACKHSVIALATYATFDVFRPTMEILELSAM